MKALILAAGYATRLYPLTREYPKPLLKVKDKPIISHIIGKLEGIPAIDEIIVVTNSKFFPQFQKWLEKALSSKEITVVDDLTKDNAGRLGAVGDMYFAIQERKIRDNLLVIGGDNLFEEGLGRFFAYTEKIKTSPIIGAYDIGDKVRAAKYGVLKLNPENRIVDFAEKPAKPQSSLVAMCVYYFPKDSLDFIEEYRHTHTSRCDASGSYIDWLSKKTAVYGFVFSGRWYDIGDHYFFNEAKANFK